MSSDLAKSHVVTGAPNRRGRKFPIGTFEFLQAYDVRPCVL